MERCLTCRARPNPPSVTSVLHISQTPLSLISVWLWWNKVPGPGWDTVPLFSISKDVWGKLMIWMSLSPPGQVYSSQIVTSLPWRLLVFSFKALKDISSSVFLWCQFMGRDTFLSISAQRGSLLVPLLLWGFLCFEIWSLCWEGQWWSTLFLMVEGTLNLGTNLHQ